MPIPLISISSPVGAMPLNSPPWVPRIFQRVTTLSPSAIWSSMVAWRSRKAERNSAWNRLTSSGPRSTIDPSGWWARYLSKISSARSKLPRLVISST
jgi:hypothetical protein